MGAPPGPPPPPPPPPGPAAATATAAWIVAASLASAPAVHDAFGIGQLVPEAAFQPSTQARQLGGIQAEILLLRHLDRHRLEGGQERRAAKRTSAGAVAADQLRLVTHADLPHLDARPKFGSQLAHQLAEIDAAVSGEVEDQLRSVERLLDAGELHAEPALAD